MAKRRDYRAEYARRIERLTAEGYSRSQARGHAKTKQIRDAKTGQTRSVRVERPIRVERVREKVERARREAFGGELPKRKRGESPREYDDRLAGIRVEVEDRDQELEVEQDFDFDDMDDFLDSMRDLGLTEHEAYDLWFGY